MYIAPAWVGESRVKKCAGGDCVYASAEVCYQECTVKTTTDAHVHKRSREVHEFKSSTG